MKKWEFLNANRVKTGALASEDSDGFNGAFQIVVNGLNLLIIASDGEGWRHVSVSIIGRNGRPTLPPSWSIMCQVKDLFWEPEDWVVQYHPAHSEYVNNHPGVLHLWQPLTSPLPTPPALLVGIKAAGEIKTVEQAMSLRQQALRGEG